MVKKTANGATRRPAETAGKKLVYAKAHQPGDDSQDHANLYKQA